MPQSASIVSVYLLFPVATFASTSNPCLWSLLIADLVVFPMLKSLYSLIKSCLSNLCFLLVNPRASFHLLKFFSKEVAVEVSDCAISPYKDPSQLVALIGLWLALIYGNHLVYTWPLQLNLKLFALDSIKYLSFEHTFVEQVPTSQFQISIPLINSPTLWFQASFLSIATTMVSLIRNRLCGYRIVFAEELIWVSTSATFLLTIEHLVKWLRGCRFRYGSHRHFIPSRLILLIIKPSHFLSLLIISVKLSRLLTQLATQCVYHTLPRLEGNL